VSAVPIQNLAYTFAVIPDCVVLVSSIVVRIFSLANCDRDVVAVCVEIHTAIYLAFQSSGVVSSYTLFRREVLPISQVIL
jgi:hypothetical protein